MSPALRPWGVDHIVATLFSSLVYDRLTKSPFSRFMTVVVVVVAVCRVVIPLCLYCYNRHDHVITFGNVLIYCDVCVHNSG